MQVSPAAPTVSAGQTFRLDLLIDTSVVTRGAQFGERYDPRLFEIVDVSEGPLYRAWADKRRPRHSGHPVGDER